MRLASLLAFLLVLGCSRAVAPLPPAAEVTPEPVRAIELPRDAKPHDALTEWWYFTGHLQSETGQQYGFEFTVFQARRQSAPAGYLAHFAITDIGQNTFSHEARWTQGDAFSDFPLLVQDWTLQSERSFQARMSDYGLSLQVEAQKPAALHHGGYIDMGVLGGSYYYSETRLQADGELAIGAETAVRVSGEAWMDHQWGNFVVSGGGWDWYSLQFDDRSELMLYVLRSAAGETTAVYGTRVMPDGSTSDVTASVEALGTWRSPHTGGVYPSGWRLTLEDGAELTLSPLLEDQELYFPGVGGMIYWEGAVSVSGTKTGRGYVELTGYAP
jgi:predicted secreted hydrolase